MSLMPALGECNRRRSMLNEHFTNIEERLKCSFKVQESSGHPIHKGTPREALVREFLLTHIGGRLSIGTGEVVDVDSRPGDARNQIDIVLYNANFPKIDFLGGISGFLVESVVATIEVKSLLKKEDVISAMNSAKRIKAMDRSGMKPTFLMKAYRPKLMSFVVAYKSKSKIERVCSWLNAYHEENGVPTLSAGEEAIATSDWLSPTLDAIFVVGNGYTLFSHGEGRWKCSGPPKDPPGLMLLTMLITAAGSGSSGFRCDLVKYLQPAPNPTATK